MTAQPECLESDVAAQGGCVGDNGHQLVLGKHHSARSPSRWLNISDLYWLLRSAKTCQRTDP